MKPVSARAWTRGALAALTAVLAAALAPAQAQSVLTVEVFANSAMHVTPQPSDELPYKLTIYRLDGLQQMEQTLNQQLPQDEAQAQEWMLRHQKQIAERYRAHIISAANGMTMMMRYRLNRLPAIVIDQRTVVYGLTDVDAAIERAQQHAHGEDS